MALFSCYVDIERFLGEPVKELAQFLCCLRRGKRAAVIRSVAELLKEADSIGEFKRIERKRAESFFPFIEKGERDVLWKLIKRFYLKPSENSSGRRIPQNELIALRKGRLFEEIVFRLGPVRKWKVDLVSMHCQPMVNRERLRVRCGERDLSGKNVDVVFWGRDYVEGYECKSNLDFYVSIGMGRSEKSRKVRDKIRYLNQLARELKRHFGEVHINLASFFPGRSWERHIGTIRSWLKECGDGKVHFEFMTIDEFLNLVD